MTDLDGKVLVLSLTVIADTPTHAVNAWEILGRAAVGIALDGIQVGTTITTVEPDTEEEDAE